VTGFVITHSAEIKKSKNFLCIQFDNPEYQYPPIVSLILDKFSYVDFCNQLGSYGYAQ